MPLRHACPLCDYSRPAEHATVLDPHCPRCGGVLELAEHHDAVPRAQTTSSLAALTRSGTADWALTLLVTLPLVAAAGKLAWAWEGAGAGLAAVVMAALTAYVAIAPATRHR